MAIGAAVLWSAEPFFRREILFERSVVLVRGNEVRGTFTPDLAASFSHVEVRFPDAGSLPLSEPDPIREAVTERLAQALRGGWRSKQGPPGLRVSVEIAAQDRRVHTATSGDHLVGTFGPRYVSVSLTSFRAHAEVEHAFVVRIEHAEPTLAGFAASLTVANGGDWWSYRSLEQVLRPVLAALALLLGACLVWLLRRLVRRRSA